MLLLERVSADKVNVRLDNNIHGDTNNHHNHLVDIGVHFFVWHDFVWHDFVWQYFE